MKLSLSPRIDGLRKMKDRMKLSLSPRIDGLRKMKDRMKLSFFMQEIERPILTPLSQRTLSIGPTTQALGHAPKILKGAFSYTKWVPSYGILHMNYFSG